MPNIVVDTGADEAHNTALNNSPQSQTYFSGGIFIWLTWAEMFTW